MKKHWNYIESLVFGYENIHGYVEWEQGRIQDLSEGGGKIFRNQKIHNYEHTIAPHAKFFFDLKDSKRVNIND